MNAADSRILEDGRLFGQYRILRLLGRGGMGEVYDVEHTILGSRYALKLMRPEILQVPGALERFRREARAMHQLRHPHILHVDEFGETEGRMWLRMELAEGWTPHEGSPRLVSLLDVLRFHEARAQVSGGRAHAPEEQVHGWLGQMLDALAYAHTHPQGEVVHRDIKPANLLLDGPAVKVSDFGLVHLAGEQWLQDQFQRSMTVQAFRREMSDGATRLTDPDASSGAHAILGTFEYMSPESRSGQMGADPRGDLYAVGKIAFQLLTGEREIGFDRVADLVPGLHPGWDAWLARALKSRPEDRFPTAAAMRAALPVLAVGTPPPVPAAPPPIPVAPPPKAAANPKPSTAAKAPLADPSRSKLSLWRPGWPGVLFRIWLLVFALEVMVPVAFITLMAVFDFDDFMRDAGPGYLVLVPSVLAGGMFSVLSLINLVRFWIGKSGFFAGWVPWLGFWTSIGAQFSYLAMELERGRHIGFVLDEIGEGYIDLGEPGAVFHLWFTLGASVYFILLGLASLMSPKPSKTVQATA